MQGAVPGGLDTSTSWFA